MTFYVFFCIDYVSVIVFGILSMCVLLKDSFERKSTASDVQLSSWANSVLDLKNSQADPLIPNILESMPQDNVDAINERQRQHSRQDAIFSLYPPQPEVCDFGIYHFQRLYCQQIS